MLSAEIKFEVKGLLQIAIFSFTGDDLKLIAGIGSHKNYVQNDRKEKNQYFEISFQWGVPPASDKDEARIMYACSSDSGGAGLNHSNPSMPAALDAVA